MFRYLLSVSLLAFVLLGGDAKAQQQVIPCVPTTTTDASGQVHYGCINVTSANPLPTTGGGGGSGNQGTPNTAANAWPFYLVQGTTANSATNPIFVNPGTGATFAVTESGIWQVTPTLTAVSTLSLTSSTTAYTAGQIAATSATAASIVNPSFTMPTLGGAVPRLRLQSTDTVSTAWAGQTVQIDLWSAAPTWTNGDHGTWLPATGSASHIASFTCAFPSAVWGDGIATECTPNQGNYASVTSTTVYWSVQATSGSGVLTASKAFKLIAELN